MGSSGAKFCASRSLTSSQSNTRTTPPQTSARPKPGSAGDWKPTEASKAVEYECSIKRTFRRYDGTALKRKLKTTRLTQRTTQGLLQMQAPSLMRIGEDDPEYLFNGLILSLSTMRVSTSRSRRVSNTPRRWRCSKPISAMHEAHAHSEFQHAARGDHATTTLFPAAGRNLPCLNSLVDAYNGNARQPQKPAASTESFVGRTSKGRAANEFDVIAVDELDTMNLEADLTDAIVSADAASKKCSRAFSGLLCDDGSTADISEAGGCDNDEEDFTDDTSIIGLIDNTFDFANKNATRSTCPLQLPWGKGVPDHEVRHPFQERGRG